MSNLINKVKDTLSSNKDKHNDARSDNYGPHSSNVANTADPRVDSNPGGVHHDQGYGSGPAGTTNNYGASGTGYGDSNLGGGYSGNTTTAGPHSSNLANRADPRIDSDLDGGRTLGHGQQGGYGSSATGGYGSNQAPAYNAGTTGGQPGAYGTQGSNTAGPHNSNLANKLDPRVDSDRDNRNDPTSRVGGYGGQENYGVSGSNPAPSSGGNYGNTGYVEGAGAHPHQGHHGHHGHHGHQGQHNQQAVGTGYDNQAGYGQQGFDNRATGQTGYNEPGYGVGQGQYGSSATPGSGDANKTAGPHNSNLLNKLDPRVDSDLDGSKTYAGNATHQ